MILSGLLYRLYGCKRPRIRRVVCSLIRRLEGGQMLSPTLRRIFKDYHDIEIGLYSYGSCFDSHAIAPFTRIGRYCSFADGVRVFNGNHPIEFKSTHPYFYNPAFGYVDKELIPRNKLTIGNDVWLGYNSVILPTVSRIGDGAVVGAGAIVTKDVPDFAVVVGNPATVVRYRFSEATRKEISNSQWWNKTIEDLQDEIPEFTHSLG